MSQQSQNFTRYNRESGRKTLLFIGIIISLITILTILSLLLLMAPQK